jgi:hypothetical protein
MINELQSQLIEKEEENNRLRQQLSEMMIRYDALRTLTNSYSLSEDAEAQKQAVSQVMGMGEIFKT